MATQRRKTCTRARTTPTAVRRRALLRSVADPARRSIGRPRPERRPDHDVKKCEEAAARARDAEAFKNGMTVKEINAAFGERAGELKKPAKRVALIDMGLIHLFMM